MRARDERGQAGGVEALAFGALLFIAGTLIVANAWSVVDAKFAAISAAREGAATYVESGATADAADPPARQAASAALASLQRKGDVAFSIGPEGYRRCGRVTVRVVTQVPILRVPFVRAAGGTMAVTGSASRRIDPFRSTLAGEAVC